MVPSLITNQSFDDQDKTPIFIDLFWPVRTGELGFSTDRFQLDTVEELLGQLVITIISHYDSRDFEQVSPDSKRISLPDHVESEVLAQQPVVRQPQWWVFLS